MFLQRRQDGALRVGKVLRYFLACLFCESDPEVVFYVDASRADALERLSQRVHVVIGHPAVKGKAPVVEQRLHVEKGDNILDLLPFR